MARSTKAGGGRTAKAAAKAPAKKAAKRSPAKRGGKSGAAASRTERMAKADPAFAGGLEVRRAMWGAGGAEDQIDAASDFLLPMQEIVTRYCFGETWTRDALPRKARSMITLGILVAQGRPHELRVHVEGALANGCTAEEIGEVLRHSMVYCGIPRGVEAFRVADEVLRERGKA